jgi:hypothetical protein
MNHFDSVKRGERVMKTADTKSRWIHPVLVWILAFIPTILPAQSIWLDRSRGGSVSIEILKPDFKNDRHTKFFTSAIFLSARLPIADSTWLAVEVPVAHASTRGYEIGYYSFHLSVPGQSETAIGNPYIGLEMESGDKKVLSEFGIRIPLTSEKKYIAPSIGLISDYDRMEAFMSKCLSGQISVNFHLFDASGKAIRLRFGPDLWINTTSGESADKTEIFLHYSAQAGYEGNCFTFLAGATGKCLLSEDNLTLAERTFHQLGFEVNAAAGRFRPGIHYRIPLDKKVSETLNNVCGFNCSVRLD